MRCRRAARHRGRHASFLFSTRMTARAHHEQRHVLFALVKRVYGGIHIFSRCMGRDWRGQSAVAAWTDMLIKWMRERGYAAAEATPAP